MCAITDTLLADSDGVYHPALFNDRLILGLKSTVLDGEIVCLDKSGKSQFKSLMYRHGEAYFYAFDILQLDGRDCGRCRTQAGIEAPNSRPAFRPLVCGSHRTSRRASVSPCLREDLAGIVAKLRNGAYDCQHSTFWIKIKNPAYTQTVGRPMLIDRRCRLRAAVAICLGCDSC